MGKIGSYQPAKEHKNYLLPTSKPIKSHAIYEEKVWTLQEQIYKKLTTVAKFLESLYPKLTGDVSMNIKVVIEKNLEILVKDIDLMQSSFHKDPYSFKTSKLKTNQKRITEMKNVCDSLQTVSSYEKEVKKLGKIKHELHELEHLIEPNKFEIAHPVKKVPKLKKASAVKAKPKKAPAVKTKAAAKPKKAPAVKANQKERKQTEKSSSS